MTDLVHTNLTGKQYAVMIIIVIATLLTIYYLLWQSDFDLFKPQSWFRPEVEQGDVFFASNFELTSDNLYLHLGQKKINDVEVTGIKANGNATGNCKPESCPQLIREGEKGSFNVQLSPPLEQGNRIFFDVIITYTDLKTKMTGKTDRIVFTNVRVL